MGLQGVRQADTDTANMTKAPQNSDCVSKLGLLEEIRIPGMEYVFFFSIGEAYCSSSWPLREINRSGRQSVAVLSEGAA